MQRAVSERKSCCQKPHAYFFRGDSVFKVGDAVVYGNTGVCYVMEITEKNIIKNKKTLYYVLKPCFQQNNVIYAPVNSDKVFIRPVMSRAEAEKLIEDIPRIIAEKTALNGDAEAYKTSLETHKAEDLVQLTSEIYRKKKEAKQNSKKIGFVDEKYMQVAQDLLFGELSVSLGIPFEDVGKYIENKIKG